MDDDLLASIVGGLILGVVGLIVLAAVVVVVGVGWLLWQIARGIGFLVRLAWGRYQERIAYSSARADVEQMFNAIERQVDDQLRTRRW
jgi:hypothetical protein